MKNKSNIETTMDDNDFVMFKTTCDCNSDNHSLTVIVEKLGENDYRPLVSLYFKCSRVDKDSNFFKNMWKRIKDSLQILFTGYLDIDEEFIFRDNDHLKDFRNTLEEAINQVESVGKTKV